MVEIQQRGIEFLRSVQKVGTSYRALGLAERSSNERCRMNSGVKWEKLTNRFAWDRWWKSTGGRSRRRLDKHWDLSMITLCHAVASGYRFCRSKSRCGERVRSNRENVECTVDNRFKRLEYRSQRVIMISLASSLYNVLSFERVFEWNSNEMRWLKAFGWI